MEQFKISSKNKQIIIALGAESAGNFSVFKNGTVYFSQDFGDLTIDTNFNEYLTSLNQFLKNNEIKPDVILSDLHPLFRTTGLAQGLAKKYKAEHIPVQHHLAHVFSAIGDRMAQDTKYEIRDTILGIACDGTGYGLDEKIWGGEIFTITKIQETRSKQETNSKLQITRVAHLENQTLIGGEKAIQEPARILISILSKFLSKEEVHFNIKKYYSKNDFEVLWNQLEQNFNCLETSSTARILDAVSVLLGFSKNERLGKHGPVGLLEKNSTIPYQIKPQVIFDKKEKMWILQTTPLFEYLIKNINKDKFHLAATAQKYIADGLVEILCHSRVGGNPELSMTLSAKSWIPDQVRNDKIDTFFSGGMANNNIMSSTLESQGIYTNKKIPHGDAGISFGQIFYYLLTNPRH